MRQGRWKRIKVEDREETLREAREEFPKLCEKYMLACHFGVISAQLLIELHDNVFVQCVCDNEEECYQLVVAELQKHTIFPSSLRFVKQTKQVVFPVYMCLRRFFPIDVCWIIVDLVYSPKLTKRQVQRKFLQACRYLGRYYVPEYKVPWESLIE